MIEYSTFVTLNQDYKTTHIKIDKSFNPVNCMVFTESIIIYILYYMLKIYKFTYVRDKTFYKNYLSFLNI